MPGFGASCTRWQQQAVLRLLVGALLDPEPDVGPVEAPYHRLGVLHPEPLHDVFAHARAGGGGEREDRRPAELLDDLAEAGVVGPEVVPPLAHAVRLVDDEQRGLVRHHALQRLLVVELLGREEEVFEVARAEVLERFAPLPHPLHRVDDGRPREALFLDELDLILLKCDERRHDDRGPADEQAGDLVDRRFS
jgi:hypothetical protein